MQPQVTPLAVRMTPMNGKRVRLVFCAAAGFGGVEKGVAAFRAEKVKLVIVPLAEEIVVERDEARVDNGSFTVMALMGEFLN